MQVELAGDAGMTKNPWQLRGNILLDIDLGQNHTSHQF
jgi:hypothetical protein